MIENISKSKVEVVQDQVIPKCVQLKYEDYSRLMENQQFNTDINKVI